MKVTQLKLANFTVFESAEFAFASGINVFIGENATGKSHLLKMMYALLKAARATRSTTPENDIEKALSSVFLPDDETLVHLMRARGEDEACTFWIKADGSETHASLTENGDVGLTVNRWLEPPQPLYIPARDVLAMYEGFASLYERAKISFDVTYYDICLALQSPTQRGEAKVSADQLAAPLTDLLGGEVELRGPRFYVNAGDGPREAHLTAEGLRKIATLVHLVNNGSIAPGTTLLWDEPETNLNPRLVVKLAEALRFLASHGVQVFIATHDFLLTHQLSLASEYDSPPKVEIKFFSLHRDERAEPVEVEHASIVSKLTNNPILDAYAQYYENQRELYRQNLERDLKDVEP